MFMVHGGHLQIEHCMAFHVMLSRYRAKQLLKLQSLEGQIVPPVSLAAEYQAEASAPAAGEDRATPAAVHARQERELELADRPSAHVEQPQAGSSSAQISLCETQPCK